MYGIFSQRFQGTEFYNYTKKGIIYQIQKIGSKCIEVSVKVGQLFDSMATAVRTPNPVNIISF